MQKKRKSRSGGVEASYEAKIQEQKGRSNSKAGREVDANGVAASRKSFGPRQEEEGQLHPITNTSCAVRGVCVSIEIEIMSYLYTYGNTKGSDLLFYGTRTLSKSSKIIKSTLDRMVLEGKIHRLIHNKIGPKAVYFTLGEHLSNETLVYLETEILGARGKGQTEIHEQALRILKEAADVAEKRVKKRFPASKY